MLARRDAAYTAVEGLVDDGLAAAEVELVVVVVGAVVGLVPVAVVVVVGAVVVDVVGALVVVVVVSWSSSSDRDPGRSRARSP